MPGTSATTYIIGMFSTLGSMIWGTSGPKNARASTTTSGPGAEVWSCTSPMASARNGSSAGGVVQPLAQSAVEGPLGGSAGATVVVGTVAVVGSAIGAVSAEAHPDAASTANAIAAARRGLTSRVRGVTDVSSRAMWCISRTVHGPTCGAALACGDG